MSLLRLTNVLPAVVLAAAVAGGCARHEDLSKVPAGTEVEVTRRDGGVVHGKLTSANDKQAVIRVGLRDRTVATTDIADVRRLDTPDAAKAEPPKVAKFREFVVPEGTALTVRLDTAIASESSRPEDPVEGTLSEAIEIDHTQVLPAGTRVSGVVSDAVPSGKVQGRAVLAVNFTSVTVNGERFPISGRIRAEAPSTKGEDAKKIGIPAVGGAIVGAILGGKKGAAIGAVIGGGAGTAVVLTTPGKDIHWPHGTEVAFSLTRDADVRVPIKR